MDDQHPRRIRDRRVRQRTGSRSVVLPRLPVVDPHLRPLLELPRVLAQRQEHELDGPGPSSMPQGIRRYNGLALSVFGPALSEPLSRLALICASEAIVSTSRRRPSK